jgi:leucyl/phenylalanyl-tRNA--protein transferase
MTAHLATFGAVEVPRDRYQRMLNDAIRGDATIDGAPLTGAQALALASPF